MFPPFDGNENGAPTLRPLGTRARRRERPHAPEARHRGAEFAVSLVRVLRERHGRDQQGRLQDRLARQVAAELGPVVRREQLDEAEEDEADEQDESEDEGNRNRIILALHCIFPFL